MQAGNNNLHMLIFDYNQTSTGGAGTKSFIWATITNQSLGGMLHQHFFMDHYKVIWETWFCRSKKNVCFSLFYTIFGVFLWNSGKS